MATGTQICELLNYGSVRFAGASNCYYSRGYRVLFYSTTDYYAYYRTSSDGTTWSNASVVSDATLNGDRNVLSLAVAYDDANYRFHVFWVPDTGYLRYRSGTMGSNGTITWDAVVSVNTATTNDKIGATVDSSGHPIVTYMNGSYPFVDKSTTTSSASAWASASSFPYQMSATSNTSWIIKARAGTNNKFYVGCAYTNGYFYGRMYDGSSFGSEEAQIGGNIAYAWGFDFCFDDEDNVWYTMFYNTTGYKNTRIYKRSIVSNTWDTTYFWAPHLVTASMYDPQLIWQNGKLYLFGMEWTTADTAGYYSIDGAKLDSQIAYINESTATIYNAYGINPFKIGTDKIGIAYPTYPSSVYTLTYVEMDAPAAEAGPKWNEKLTSWTPTSTGYETKNLYSLYGVPKGAVCQIAMLNANEAVDVALGVRTYGSSLERYITLHEAESGGSVINTMFVKTDETTGSIQTVCDTTTGVTFTLLGYWTGTNYTETIEVLSTGTTGAWTDINLSSSVGASKVATFSVVNTAIDLSTTVGVRTNGSALSARYFEIHEAEGAGGSVDGIAMCAKTDANGLIEYYTSSSGGAIVLLGYFDSSMDYVEKAPTAVSISSASTWTDCDVSASLDQDGRVVECFVMSNSRSTEYLAGVRAYGTYAARYLTPHEAETNGYTGYSALCGTSTTGLMQAATGNVSYDYIGVMGYFIPIAIVASKAFVQCIFVG